MGVDFLDDLKEIVESWLDSYGIKYKEKDTLRDLLINYFSFQDKYAFPQKRNVHYSKELRISINTYDERAQIAINKLKTWVENGVDINGFQSRGLYGARGERDYQNMLYGVVHLHLSASKNDELPKIKKNGFAKPSDKILIALFKEQEAYFVDVIQHPQSIRQGDTKWTSKRTLEIIANNWPFLVEQHLARGMTLCHENGEPVGLNDENIRELTTKHINTPIQIGKKTYFPNTPIATSGHSIRAVMRADMMINDAQKVQESCHRQKKHLHDEWKKFLISQGRAVPNSFDVHLDYFAHYGRFFVYDRISGVAWDYQKQKLRLF